MYDFSSAGPVGGVATACPPDPAGRPESAGHELDWLRALGWREFEQLVGQAYRLQGYEVLPTAHGADGGIDLILTRGSERIFVQCKHWNAHQVGVKVVRELYGLVAAHGATWGIVATSGNFTEEAEEFARQARITLLNGHAVAQLVVLGAAADPNPSAALTQPSPVPAPRNATAEPSCPICSAAMTLRTARRGPEAGSRFWGCTRYPGCKGVRPAPQSAQPTPRRPRRASNPLIAALFVLPLAGVLAVGGVMAGASSLVTTISHLGAPPAASLAGAATTFGEQTMDVAYDSSAKLIYTANYVSGDVTVADAKTLAPRRTIDVPGKPVAVAVDPQHHRLYVADGSAKKVYVIDTSSRRKVATLATSAKPSDLAVDVARQRLFVVSKATDKLEVFNTATRSRLATKAIGFEPNAVAVDPSDHQIIVAGATTVVLSGYSLTATGILPTFGTIRGLAVDARTNRVYLSRSSSVQEYNLVTGKSKQWSTPTGAGIAVNPTTRQVYVAVPDRNSVEALSVK